MRSWELKDQTILLFITSENVYRTVWRIYTLLSGCKGLKLGIVIRLGTKETGFIKEGKGVEGMLH